ncbi:MAG: hypothetical protein ACR2F2_08020 [Pyrinomonadaceae bacterium]
MSSRKLKKIEKEEFAGRFAEVCGTFEPAKISRLLDISYQAARNYLEGRLPDASVLLAIAEKTPFSIHWLLTGRGDKLADNRENKEEKIFFEKICEASKEGCTIALQEAFGENARIPAPKTVSLDKSEVRSEKSKEETPVPNFSDE